jgi:hypothetical protein
MALLRAYFDESGTHNGARVTGVSGFIGPVDEWDRLENEWESELERFTKDTGHEIKDFHAYECENGEEFWVGIHRSIREAYYQRLARVLVKYTALMGVSFSIENDKWDAFTSAEFKKRYRSPYQLCADSCFQQVASYSTNRAGGSPVALVFAEHQQYSRHIEEVFSYYMSNKVWSHIKSFTTSSPEGCYPLQCADMMSYESYRYWDEIGKGNTGNMVDRPAWSILADAGHFQFSACYGGSGLLNAVERFHFNEKLGRSYPSGH